MIKNKTKRKTYAKKSVPKTVRKYVKSQINKNIEDKYFIKRTQFTGVDDIHSSNPVWTDLNDIDVGTTVGERVGRKVKNMYMDLTISFYPKNSASIGSGDPAGAIAYNAGSSGLTGANQTPYRWLQTNHIRYFVIRQKQPDATFFDPYKFMIDDGGSALRPTSLLNRALDVFKLYDIIYDSGIIKLEPQSEYVAPNYLIKHYFKLDNITSYNNDSGSTGELNILTNKLTLLIVTDANINHAIDAYSNVQLAFQDA